MKALVQPGKEKTMLSFKKQLQTTRWSPLLKSHIIFLCNGNILDPGLVIGFDITSDPVRARKYTSAILFLKQYWTLIKHSITHISHIEALNASQKTKEVSLTPFLQLVPTNETGFCAYYPVFETYPTDTNTLSGAISGCIVSGPTKRCRDSPTIFGLLNSKIRTASLAMKQTTHHQVQTILKYSISMYLMMSGRYHAPMCTLPNRM